jgi:hypothetical protein
MRGCVFQWQWKLGSDAAKLNRPFMESTLSAREKVRLLAPDLTRQYPRSPRETLAGYVLAARVLDKCRADVNATVGEYKYNCPLDRVFFEFTSIDAEAFRDYVATGPTDQQVADWIGQHAKSRSRAEVIAWNNQLREKRIGELPPETQEFMEDYIPKFIPKNRPIYVWFDVFDIEEERM